MITPLHSPQPSGCLLVTNLHGSHATPPPKAIPCHPPSFLCSSKLHVCASVREVHHASNPRSKVKAMKTPKKKSSYSLSLHPSLKPSRSSPPCEQILSINPTPIKPQPCLPLTT
eukprot:TRINITY_DN13246_c0_g1_i1.p1 TRINITY_DN13246_c0_g1~~TRINITY_DN13246_c0_g1_i1.p1  ORF type:complete len:114 (-),score=5.63 TRINITY_DN13246_c0_g1_i1:34-375(-)